MLRKLPKEGSFWDRWNKHMASLTPKERRSIRRSLTASSFGLFALGLFLALFVAVLGAPIWLVAWQFCSAYAVLFFWEAFAARIHLATKDSREAFQQAYKARYGYRPDEDVA